MHGIVQYGDTKELSLYMKVQFQGARDIVRDRCTTGGRVYAGIFSRENTV